MELKTEKAQMDEYLMTIQRKAKAALDGFERSDLTIDNGFLNNFLKQSFDCLKQTCNEFNVEAKLKSASHTTATMMTAAMTQTEDTMILFDGLDEYDALMGKGYVSMKHKLEKAINIKCKLMKKQKLMESTVNMDTNGNTDLGQQFEHTVFYCAHCLNDEKPTESFSGTIDEIYVHWIKSHLDESICKPFQFYAVALVGCFHCGETGTHHDLVNHHKQQHPSKQFTIFDRIDPKKCGICQFKDGNLVEHFETKHQTAAKQTCLNPITYSKERIKKFLSINMHQNLYSSEKRPGYLICGFCQKKVDFVRYLSHYNEHYYEFKCSHCTLFRSADLVELVLHEKNAHSIDSLNFHCTSFSSWIRKKYLNTTLVFGNGLILKNFNVIRTKFDESKHFEEFINEFLNTKREEVKKRLESEDTDDTLNGAQDASPMGIDTIYGNS